MTSVTVTSMPIDEISPSIEPTTFKPKNGMIDNVMNLAWAKFLDWLQKKP